MATFAHILPVLLHYYEHDGHMVSQLSRLSSVIIRGGYYPLYGEAQEMANLFYTHEAEEILDQRGSGALAAFGHDTLDSENARFSPSDYWDSD